MKSQWKKILSIAMATASVASTMALSACGDKGVYKGDKVTDYVSDAAVSSNGGFAAEKGDFVYFINGMESYEADNEYGEVVKGALMRISKADLANGNYDNTITVVPSLLVAQNVSGGIYIFGDYVYYATPTTDKDIKTGQVEKGWLDFKRAKLDGTAAPEDYFFRVEENNTTYRFVEEDNVVYCLYEEDGALKSYDTKDKVSRTLVEGASTYFYDTVDATSGDVYYTMNLKTEGDFTIYYNQVYCVNAAARIDGEPKVENGRASYTVKGGKTYSFDAEKMEEENEEKKEADKNATDLYDFEDYTTYPYVNLGTLVLDGIGYNAVEATQYNEATSDENKPLTGDGYTYTLTMNVNGNLYFTRKDVGGTTSSNAESKQLYCLKEDAKNAAGWKAVSGNKVADGALEVVAPDGDILKAAIFTLDEAGNHVYYYLASDVLYKVTETETIEMSRVNMAGATLWQVAGNYLYYLQDATEGNGYTLSRINVTGTASDYKNAGPLDNDAYIEFKPVAVVGAEINSSWYLPEIIGTTLLYGNEQAVGDTSYNYVYAANLGENQAQLNEINEKYEAVQDYINEYEDEELKAALTYYFRTGERTAFDAVADLYTDEQKEEFNQFVQDVADNKQPLQTAFFNQVGKTNEADAEAIKEAWANSLLKETTEDEESKGLPTWAIVLICVGGGLIVAGAVVAVVLVTRNKRIKQQQIDATVNAYKRPKIDTTDDKSIDVYADETEETPAEQTAEETVEEAATEEVVEETVEEKADEAVEEVVEEAPAVEEVPAVEETSAVEETPEVKTEE